MCEKLKIFPYGQYIIENVIFMGFWRHSQVLDRNGGCEEMYSDATARRRYRSIDDVIIIVRRRVYLRKYITRKCLCKRVDVYIITISCTWRIYALSERLLVSIVLSALHFFPVCCLASSDSSTDSGTMFPRRHHACEKLLQSELRIWGTAFVMGHSQITIGDRASPFRG